jgi:Transposase DDE domain
MLLDADEGEEALMIGSEGIGVFGDVRRGERGAWLFDRIVATGSLVLRTVGGNRAGEIAAHRFLDSPRVSAAEIIETLGRRTGERCCGRRIIAVQDTTEINFSGRDRARCGLGPAGDGKTPGFFMHAAVAVDAEDEAVIGLLDGTIWTRPAGPRVEARRRRGLEQKESHRWLSTAQAVAERAAGASQLIVVGDRESDIFALFARRPAAVELVVRAAQDRSLADGTRLFACAGGWPVLGSCAVRVGPRGPGDKGRTAVVSLRAGAIRVARPRHGVDRDTPQSLDLTLIEAREERPPAGSEAIHWRLITTLPVGDVAAAQGIVQIYRLRWRIEQTFRACKSDGLGLPDLQTHNADRLFKISALALGAAVRTIQLVDARNGGSRPGSDVADPEILDAAAAICPSLEGNTPRQRNPHLRDSLSWLSWIVARLGGWNCYYKPPGPKTMRTGWDKLAAMAAGYHLAMSVNH